MGNVDLTQYGITGTTEIVYIRTWYQNALLAATIVTAVLTALLVILSFVMPARKAKKQAQ